jgi:hypothetical protein
MFLTKSAIQCRGEQCRSGQWNLARRTRFCPPAVPPAIKEREMSGQQPDRRAEERSHLVRFLDSLPGALAGVREFSDKPDLVIHTASTHRIGIEHTQLFRTDGARGRRFPKEAESLESRCVERARTLFEEQGGPSLYVYVYFNDRPIRKVDVRGIAERLAAVVARIAPTVPGVQREVEAWSYNRTAPEKIPEEIEELWIIKPAGKDPESLWGVPRGGTVPEPTRDQIQQAIDEKSTRLAEYRSRCDEVWLLLVADGFSPATDLRLPEGFTDTFVFAFDRVFYFHSFSLKVVELARTPTQAQTTT